MSDEKSMMFDGSNSLIGTSQNVTVVSEVGKADII